MEKYAVKRIATHNALAVTMHTSATYFMVGQVNRAGIFVVPIPHFETWCAEVVNDDVGVE